MITFFASAMALAMAGCSADGPETAAQYPLERFTLQVGANIYHANIDQEAGTVTVGQIKYGGQVPSDVKSLMTLAGVGKKTANVVYAVAFGGDAIAVDTHVSRLAERIGFCDTRDPLKVEEVLNKALPKDKWSHAHHLLIHHGRYTCHSRMPDCGSCTICQYCRYYNQKT